MVSGSFYSDMATKMPALMERWCITVCISYALFTNLYKILKFTSDKNENYVLQFSSFQSLSRVRLFVTPWTAACQASLSFTTSKCLLGIMSIESEVPPNHLILCHPFFFLPSVFPSIKVFSSELAFRIRWPKYWSFNFSMSASNEYSALISFRID